MIKKNTIMKKLLSFSVVLLATINVIAQEVELTNGIYEKKVVVNADSVKAGTLYVRALEALSDLAGSQGKSKIGIDVQDKDEGLVVYKGSYFLGYGKANMLYGWDTYADFTLKVRCKDGKAQLSLTVPSMTFQWDGDGHGIHTFEIAEFLPVYNYKGDYKIKKAAQQYAPTIPSSFDAIINTISQRMLQEPDDF
jgi:hypothetical protein